MYNAEAVQRVLHLQRQGCLSLLQLLLLRYMCKGA